MNPRHRAYLMLLAVAVIWGMATPIIKQTFVYIPPDVFLLYRFFISCLIMLPILFHSHPRLWHTLSQLPMREWSILIVSGLLGSIGQLGFLFWGLELTSSIDASVINASSPILISLAGFYFLHEHITRRERIGLLTAFTGSLVIIIEPLLQNGRLFSGSTLGNFLVLLGTLSWVGYVIITKKLLRQNLSPFFLTTFMFFVGFLAITPIVLLLRTPASLSPILASPLSAHLGVLYMALLSGSLAYWLYQSALKTVPVTSANIFSYLTPVFTAPLAYFWLKEPFSLPLLIGCAVITIGVFIAQFPTHRLH
jgi:drug/metabolite transporter (DMT)-like permease